MKVVEVNNQEDIKRFLALSFEVYKGNPYWVSQIDSHIASFLEGTSIFCKHCKTKAFLVCDVKGVVLGRIMAQIDYVFNWHWGEGIGHLLFFEAKPDHSEAVEILFLSACNWLKEEKMDQARLAYLHGRQLPLTTDGYNDPPLAHHTYNPKYYHHYLQICDFEKEHEFVESHIQLSSEWINKYHEFIKIGEKQGITLRPINRENLRYETKEFQKLHNRTFSQHWGSTQLNYEETELLTSETLADIVFAEYQGKPIGFGLSFPDINQVARGSELKILKRDSVLSEPRITRGNIFIAGVYKEFRSKGVVRSISSKLLINMSKKGYKTATHSIAMKSNTPSIRFAQKLGAHPKKHYVTYMKKL